MRREGRTGESLAEEVAVLRDLERADGRAEDLDAEALEDAHLVELDTDVERGLTSEGEEDPVRSLLLEDVRDVLGRDRQDCVRYSVSRECEVGREGQGNAQ